MSIIHLSTNLEPPVYKLPPDLLSAIFIITLNSANVSDDLVPEHLGHVCRRWYDTVVSYGVLWTTIKLCYATERIFQCKSLVPYTRRRLKRSRGALLDISVDYRIGQWDTGYLQPFLECIGDEGQVMKRWASITVTSYHDFPSLLLDLLRYPTPQLRAANFRCGQYRHYDTSHLLPSTPRLVGMEIGDLKLRGPESAFVSPSHIPKTVTRLQIFAWDNASAWKIFSPFTYVVIMHLCIGNGAGRAPEGGPSRVTFPYLKDLSTSVVCDAISILKRISAPSLTHLRLKLGERKQERTGLILMSFESTVITQIEHLEVRALHCSSRDDFGLFMQEFGNVRELHLDRIGVYRYTLNLGWYVTQDCSSVLNDPSLCPLLERCVVNRRAREDLVALRKQT